MKIFNKYKGRLKDIINKIKNTQNCITRKYFFRIIYKHSIQKDYTNLLQLSNYIDDIEAFAYALWKAKTVPMKIIKYINQENIDYNIEINLFDNHNMLSVLEALDRLDKNIINNLHNFIYNIVQKYINSRVDLLPPFVHNVEKSIEHDGDVYNIAMKAIKEILGE